MCPSSLIRFALLGGRSSCLLLACCCVCVFMCFKIHAEQIIVASGEDLLLLNATADSMYTDHIFLKSQRDN
jgi:hypothetical protein